MNLIRKVLIKRIHCHNYIKFWRFPYHEKASVNLPLHISDLYTNIVVIYLIVDKGACALSIQLLFLYFAQTCTNLLNLIVMLLIVKDLR